MPRRRLLFVGDAGVQSGFARSTHEILKSVDYREGGEWDVTVLGMNYRGDADVRRLYPYDIYAAAPGGDPFGVGRIVWMCDTVHPDLIVIQQDPWNFPYYLRQLRMVPEYSKIPVVGIVAVDGKCCQGTALNQLTLAVFWTKFGEAEARAGGFTGKSTVIPLGVDLDIYHHGDRRSARAERIPEFIDLRRTVPRDKAFIVGAIGRNQLRKRLDLTIQYFSEWIRSRGVQDAWLWMHVGPTGDDGFDIEGLARYYGITDRTAVNKPAAFYGPPDSEMARLYQCFDVYLSTTLGEGFGLPAAEAMACGVPCILPDWSAYGDWAKGAASLVPCTSTLAAIEPISTIGGVMDREQAIQALDDLYRSQELRYDLSQRGLARVSEPRFRWAHIGQQFSQAIDAVVPAAAEVSAVA